MDRAAAYLAIGTLCDPDSDVIVAFLVPKQLSRLYLVDITAYEYRIVNLCISSINLTD